MNPQNVVFTYDHLEWKMSQRLEAALDFINSLSQEDVLRCDAGGLAVFARYYAILPPIIRPDLITVDTQVLEQTDETFVHKTGVTYHSFFIPIEREEEADWLEEIDRQKVEAAGPPIAFLDEKRSRIDIRLSTSPADEDEELKRQLDYRVSLVEQYAESVTRKIVDFNKDLAARMTTDLNRRKDALTKANKALEIVGLPRVYNPEHEERAIQIQNLLQSLGAAMRGETRDNQASTQEVHSFIVHGHDKSALLELKDYIQNTLNIGQPVVLRDQPGLGQTIIEKFERHAEAVDLVFVLLTPDDEVVNPHDSNDKKRQARPNVIFEMGFFLGALKRESGRILLLHKGPLEIPSDISGVEYIDISNGIESAGERIRRELRALGILK